MRLLRRPIIRLLLVCLLTSLATIRTTSPVVIMPAKFVSQILPCLLLLYRKQSLGSLGRLSRDLGPLSARS
ncbi:hypothetical protein B0H14DRAFT_2687927 [Mycena olivaceomarginata]|nr:hypothetical protein B0H14DRAFT_2687927 [Mycena olivaceomarginata]